MGGNFNAEGGGIHPGKPMIWPTGKSASTPVSSSPQNQAAGGARGVPTQAPARTTEAAPTQAPQTTAPAAPTAAAPAAPTIARALTVADIRSHLLNIQIEPNDFNTKLASLMLRNGVELSRGNFVKMTTMLQGSDKSQAMQEASVLLLMKGMDSPQAAKVLGQFFSQNPSIAQQYAALQQSLGNLASALGMGKAMLNSNLVSQLGTILAQFDESFRSLSDKASGGKTSATQQTALNDLRSLKALLAGVQDKAKSSENKEGQALSSALTQFRGKLDGVMDNMLAQAILSQSGRSEVNYLYEQIPNAMTTPTKDLEIVVKRDGEGKGSAVDPRNTQVVMSFETTNFGRIVISMYVKDNKVYVVFVFSEKNYGDEGRSAIAKEYGDFQKKLGDKNFLITGYQVKVDPAMCHIKPYLIPMLASLENILKRIDLEA
jgi:hypothetical protein